MENIEDILGLTPAQQGMFYQAVSAPKPGLYIEQLLLHLEGTIDPRRLRDSYRSVFERLPVLRSSFHLQNIDKPVQVIYRGIVLQWNEAVWPDDGPDGFSRRLEAWKASDAAHPFELSRGPLIRAALIRSGEQTGVFAITYHHLLLDGWSAAIVIKEVFENYFAVPENQRTRAWSGQRDHILWLQRRDNVAAERVWRDALSAFRSPGALRSERLATPADGYGQCELALSLTSTAALEKMAQRRRVSLSTVLQAAWGIQCAHIAQRMDVTFGFTVSGRPPEAGQVEGMVGMFINTIPLPLTVRIDDSIAEWLEAVAQATESLRNFDHVSLGELQQWTSLPANTSLFDSILVVENYPRHGIPNEGPLRVAQIDFGGGITHYPLVLIAISGEQLRVRAIYRRNRLDSEAAWGLLQSFEHLLREMANEVELPIRQLSIWSTSSSAYMASDAVPAAQPNRRPPQTETEKRLAPIWAEALGLGAVSIDDDFFELGGHSLTAMQLLSRIREEFQIELTIVELFDIALTVEQLGELIDRRAVVDKFAAGGAGSSNSPWT
jgi:acyl carrier protein